MRAGNQKRDRSSLSVSQSAIAVLLEWLALLAVLGGVLGESTTRGLVMGIPRSRLTASVSAVNATRLSLSLSLVEDVKLLSCRERQLIADRQAREAIVRLSRRGLWHNGEIMMNLTAWSVGEPWPAPLVG